ncbi:MAG: amidophosphoribosyltransferase [Flavobacteriales bacterium]|nr:MAG: amidophosphoribosyltransferase [Flavobacteriales bacterium]
MGGGKFRVPGTIENTITILKNDITPYTSAVLQVASERLEGILLHDLPMILNQVGMENLTICVVPRAKSRYNPDQILFKETISRVADLLDGFDNGINYIVRHTDTRTTHRNRAGYGGNGSLPYPGITIDTCTISNEVRNKDILLIDDVYTKSVCIDEDVIQALFDRGANSVTFYSIGKTV